MASVLSFPLPLLGWLFGSYTVLRWRRLAFPVLLQRLLITAAATLLVVEFAVPFFDPRETLWFIHSRLHFVWLGALVIWSVLVRIALRQGFLFPDSPRLLLLASDDESVRQFYRLESCNPTSIIRVNSPIGFEQTL